ncbi:helix-turn-helix transcriptional regulator [Sphingomonas sp.]|uniref:AraC family transcriptional regulator n=1 Tax=Sphingomonas sp. TaxID=28214 RepID=UPI0035BC2524
MDIPAKLCRRGNGGESRPGDGAGRLVLSELPRGDSPVVCTTRCLNVVLDGVERYAINGRVFTVKAGEFILVEGGTTAHATLPLRQITRGLCIYLPDAPGESSASPLGEAFQLTPAGSGFSRRLQAIGTHLVQHPEQGAAIADTLVHQVAVGLERLTAELAPKLMRIEAARPATRRELLQKMERVRHFLHDQTGRAVPLPELAQVAAMSPFHLARTFRAVHGSPPAEYHRRLRVELAAREMSVRDVSIGELAARYGFADASSFSRAYRRIVGCSPKAPAT